MSRLKFIQCWFLSFLSAVAVQSFVMRTQAMAQEDELDAGLLELLDEPASKEELRPAVQPEDIGLKQSEVEEVSGDPVEAVRQSMLIAAEYLSQGYTNRQTQTLQRDIVTRLDELIDELEQEQPNPQPNPESQQSNAEQQQESQASASESDSSASTTESPQAQQPEPSSESELNQQAGPGEVGPEANPRVQLKELQQLQEDVWGQLPERVRKQMQSQMVERFLPAYRQQIEAYFEALMKDR